jgi:hypothetical protein
LTGWKADHGVGLIECREPFGVTGVTPFDKETCQILGLLGSFTCISASHHPPHVTYYVRRVTQLAGATVNSALGEP